jgi:hypothetical protein
MEEYGEVQAVETKSGKPVNIRVDDELVKEILARVRKSGGAEKRWDINVAEGELAENELSKLLNCDGTAIEVKRDFAASKTGNVAVEFMCGGNPSGISTSRSDWWAFSLSGDAYNDEVVVLIKKARLERLLLKTRIVRGGDKARASMYLVRLEELVKPLKGIS